MHRRTYAAIGELIASGGARLILSWSRQRSAMTRQYIPLGGTARILLAGLIKAAVTVIDAEYYGRAIIKAAKQRAIYRGRAAHDRGGVLRRTA